MECIVRLMSNLRTVAVIGGGPAGMMAAIAAAKQGASVTLFEKNEKLGKKLYITGKGRCNVTNAVEAQRFLQEGVPHNPRFLQSAFARFNNQDLMQYLQELGVPLKVERGERVFPQSDKSSDIIRVLQHELTRLKVQLRFNSAVSNIARQAGRMRVMTRLGNSDFDGVVLATGGVSYPSTGSTGDGYRFSKALGHQIVEPRPSLIGLITQETWPRDLAGLTLKNVTLKAVSTQGKKLFEEQGEVLFTHVGISGPMVLSLSANIDEANGVCLAIDLKPALSAEQLDARLLRDITASPAKHVQALLDGLCPRSMVPILAKQAEVGMQKNLGQLTRAERTRIAQVLKNLSLTVKAFGPMEEAIITRGGISVKDIDPKTMASKHLDGLYFAGEVMDVDGITGGFNLQIAFTTGFCAGTAAGQASY